MKKQNTINRRRRGCVRCLSTMTIGKARMILVANALAGFTNADGTVCSPWPDENESVLAAKMMRDAAIESAENAVIR